MGKQGFVNLTQKLGEGLLLENGVGFAEVTKVDFAYDWEDGYSEWTPGESSIQAVVHYRVDVAQPDPKPPGDPTVIHRAGPPPRPRPEHRKYVHRYDHLGQVITALEKIADEDRWGPPYDD